jgi:hypothetical protein
VSRRAFRHARTAGLAAAAGLGAALLVAGAPRDARAWEWLAPAHAFDAPQADPREARLGVTYVDGGFWSPQVGHVVGIGRGGAEDGGGRGSGLSLDGMVWAWFSTLPDFNFPLETVDGSFGLRFEARRGPWSGRVRLGHVSSHLADGASEIEERRIVYSREMLTLLAARDLGGAFRVYGGPSFWVRADPPTESLQLQLGAEWRPGRGARGAGGTGSTGATGGAARIAPYAAVDLRSRNELEWRVNQSVEAGVRFPGAPGNALRAFVTYFDGTSERGQAYRESEQWFGIGLAFGD